MDHKFHQTGAQVALITTGAKLTRKRKEVKGNFSTIANYEFFINIYLLEANSNMVNSMFDSINVDGNF